MLPKLPINLPPHLTLKLIKTYCDSGDLRRARQLFDKIPTPDLHSLTVLISAYTKQGLQKEAISLYTRLRDGGAQPDKFVLLSFVKACATSRDLTEAQRAYKDAVAFGLDKDILLGNAMIDMFGKFVGRYVSYNVMISAYFENGEAVKALAIFGRMKSEGLRLNYASWNAVICGSLQAGQTQQALELLAEMQKAGFSPNQITLTAVLTACTNLESLRGGKEIHGYIYRHCFLDDTTALTALVFMYAKCGKLEFSRKVFEMMSKRDTVAWNTMIIANSMHGNGEESLVLFTEMLKSGAKPNAVTFTGVLSGCSHSRLVDEGLSIFNSMRRVHMIEPDAEHHSCIVDVLSRAGRLEEAYRFIQDMVIEPTASAWGALLGACRVYKNVDMARIAAKRLFEIEPHNPGNYVLLSNILVNAKLWGEASETRKIMKDKGIKKEPGCSWVRVKNKVHTFVVADKSNEHSIAIYKFLSDMSEKMRQAGYLPDTEFVLQDLDSEEKVDTLCNHCEKLAVAFGLLNLNGESSITVFKNLRICGDCHNAIKFMAKIVGVTIVVRDALRFHHFKDGHCSCKDFW
ncbi:pentatricopeptide repeat-containing protein [Tanacetum coccineum]